MIMTIDVGNTQIQGGLFDDTGLVFQFRRTTGKEASSDELGIFLKSVIRENGFNASAITDIAVCSVVPSINYSLASACLKYFGIEALFIQAGIKTGLKLRYANPKEIGADRIAGAIGGVTVHPDANLIIVDTGTATTIDGITKNKEYFGGAILPGLKMSVHALASGTAKLPSVEIAKPEKTYGATTVEAIQSGIYYGHLGAIKELVSLYTQVQFGGMKPYIIGTGGLSRLFEDSGVFDEIIPELVLFGLKTALLMNKY